MSAALTVIGFVSLVFVAFGMTAAALISAVAGLSFGGKVDPGAYILAVIAAGMWVLVDFMNPFDFVLKVGAA